tara:strand:+ start:116 stop:289 length:174 start_codon:yes stop_codon:yes gene_type:complete
MGSVNGRLKKIKSESKIFLVLGMYKSYNIIIGRFKPTSFIMLNKIIVKPGVPFITIL